MQNKSWLEISLLVDGELAEAAAEVLSRYVSDGVVIESTAVTASDDDSQGQAVGPLRVCAYLPVDSQVEETRRQIEEALWYLGRIRPLPAPQYRSVREEDWSLAWKEHYHPITLGRRLVIVPAWLETPHPERVAIRMDPGMAFGTGTHPTTQLCLELIETVLDGAMSEQEMIDVGCGSGILAAAALKLGASRALGVDIDPESVRAAQENAVLNGVAERLEIGLGSVAEILAGDFTLRAAPLVVANILAPVIVRLMEDGLGGLVQPGGVLILSGILDEQAGSVIAALERHNFTLWERKQQGDWVALAARRPA
jgi:ribosomal protein L11 methyltransferase